MAEWVGGCSRLLEPFYELYEAPGPFRRGTARGPECPQPGIAEAVVRRDLGQVIDEI